MIYLILLSCCLLFSLFLFVFSFIDMYVAIDLESTYYELNVYRYRLIDLLRNHSALPSFVLSIIVLLLFAGLFIYAIKEREKISNKILLILTGITSIAVLALTICVQVFTKQFYPETIQYCASIGGDEIVSWVWTYGNGIMLFYSIFTWIIFLMFMFNLSIVLVNIFGKNELKQKKFFFLSISKQEVRKQKENAYIENENSFSDESVDLLLKLNELLKNGIITQEEFDKKKKGILG